MTTPLDGTQDWDSELIQHRLLFMRRCIEKHLNLSAVLRSTSFARDQAFSRVEKQFTPNTADNIEAQLLLEAAEISLVVGDMSAGFGVLQEIVDRLLSSAHSETNGEYRGTFHEFVMASIFSALTQGASVLVSARGTTIANANRKVFFDWDHRVEPQELVRALPILLLAAAMSAPAESLESFLGEREYERRFAVTLAASAARPEFVVLGLLPAIYRSEVVRRRFHQLNRRDGFSALREMEVNYSSRIDLLRNDRFHWQALRPRAELIDWALLIAQATLIQNGILRLRIPNGRAVLPPRYFIQSLAHEFANFARRR